MRMKQPFATHFHVVDKLEKVQFSTRENLWWGLHLKSFLASCNALEGDPGKAVQEKDFRGALPIPRYLIIYEDPKYGIRDCSMGRAVRPPIQRQ